MLPTSRKKKYCVSPNIKGQSFFEILLLRERGTLYFWGAPKDKYEKDDYEKF
jgi:hypothetical protein